MGKGWTDTGYFTIVSNYVLEDASLSVKARFLYMLLVRYGRWKKVGNEKYLVTWVGRKKLSELTGESAWSVSQRIGELCDKGLIERRRRTCTSSHTYICDPRSIYTATTSIPDDDTQEDDEDYQTLELEEKEEAPVVVPEPEQDSTKDALVPPADAPDERSLVDPVEDVLIDDVNEEREEPNPRVRDSRPRGLLARRAENKLTAKSKSKIGVPDDAVAVDENNPENARALWTEFQRTMIENHSGYSVPSPTMRELANCKKLLQEHDVEDLLGLFEMAATRWPVILEKWPRLAKTPLPTFYAIFTLRRELIPLVQSGKGLTSRTHRYDAGATSKVPDIGWGDV